MNPIEKYHIPTEWEKTGSVYQVWEDGEITSQKCGSLMWQRNLHLLEEGHHWINHPMPITMGSHSYCFAPTYEAAREIHEWLKATYTKNLLTVIA